MVSDGVILLKANNLTAFSSLFVFFGWNVGRWTLSYFFCSSVSSEPSNSPCALSFSFPFLSSFLILPTWGFNTCTHCFVHLVKLVPFALCIPSRPPHSPSISPAPRDPLHPCLLPILFLSYHFLAVFGCLLYTLGSSISSSFLSFCFLHIRVLGEGFFDTTVSTHVLWGPENLARE